MSPTSERKLTLDDISDLRAYEREREEFGAAVRALKRRRRVGVGPLVTFLFENRDTVRFQIQEIARVERIISDDGIRTELDIYNTLIPEPGELSATMFIELTSDDAVRGWLPRLVGIERAVSLQLFDGSSVPAVTEEPASQLTREDTTAPVHYLRFELSPEQVAVLSSGQVELRVDHPAYREVAVLAAETVAELVADASAQG